MPVLGCIADDFTGGTDLAGMLVKAGLRTILTTGVLPTLDYDVDAVVVALKSRTAPTEQAVRSSIEALNWLRALGCQQFYFKYCSTFDSTPKGNIGPVADALLDALGSDFAIVCPAFPANKRTIYKGHLFVGDVLLGESPMRNHPLTPMKQSNLVDILAAQTDRKVGLAGYDDVISGSEGLRQKFVQLRAAGVSYAVVDALRDVDLMTIGAAVAGMPLVTAGSGVALGLTQNFPADQLLGVAANRSLFREIEGAQAVIAGSCSAATLKQVAVMREKCPAFQVDPVLIAKGNDVVGEALAWAKPLLGHGPILVFSTASPEEVSASQALLGAGDAGRMVEKTLASIAKALVEEGVQRLIVAGGETSGAVVSALDASGLLIGPEIDPGVPWTLVLPKGKPACSKLALSLKSGNFGTEDFFLKAWTFLR